MRLNSGFESRKARVEMLPLIDVVFLLLVFFIYAMLSMVLHRGVGVTLPFASTAEVNRQDYVAVSLMQDNQLLVNREPVELAGLAPAVLAQLGASGSNRLVYVECDEQADAGMAIHVLDALREVGVEEVMFASREAQ